MQRSTVVILLFGALVAAAVVVTRWLGGSAPEPQPAAPSVAAPLPATAPRDAGGVAARVGIEVHVAVRAEATFVPPPPPPPVFARAAGTGAELPVTVLAGEGAGAAPAPMRPGIALVGISLAGGADVVRQVEIRPAAPTDYRVGARVVVRGHVFGERWPLRGAVIWLGERSADGARVTAVTDAEGAFELDTPAGVGVPFVVTADTMAVHARWLEVVAPGPDLEVRMVPGTRLDVQLAAVGGPDIPTARVFVVPTGAVSTALAQYPFFLQALDDGHAVSASGRATIENLPTDGAIGVLVRHARLPGSAATEVELRPQTPPLVAPVQFAAGARRGQVVDAEQRPLAGVAVWSRRAGQELEVPASARLLPADLPLRGACRAWTDADGRFTIGTLPDAGALVSLRAPGFAGIDLPGAALDGGAPIVLPAWTGGEPSFRLLPPAAGVAWRASSDLAGGVAAALAADEAWLVSFPHPGRFSLVVTTRREGVECGRATFAGLAVTGPVELQAPRLP